MNTRLGLPRHAVPAKDLLDRMRQLKPQDADWRQGKTFSLVYHAGEELEEALQQVYGLFMHTNGLNPTAFPSLRRFENEVCSMACSLFGGGPASAAVLTSGGTESILMAVKAVREWARTAKPQATRPEILVPTTVHPAFQKAAHYFGLACTAVPVGPDYRADLPAMAAAVGRNTVMLVGSAPVYPYGVVDPIAELGLLAQQHNLWLHVDACAGGFVLPFLKELGEPIPDFDLRLPGVSSLSADLHKYGYAPKGASVVVYADARLRRHQFYVYTEWPGGIYASPSVLGTRSGGSMAAAWAVLHLVGHEGYLDLARRTRSVTLQLQRGIEAVPGLKVLGQPNGTILAIGSDALDVYALGDELTERGWVLDRQQNPPSLHLTVTVNHERAVEAFLNDLRESAEATRRLSLDSLKRGAMKLVTRAAATVLPENTFSKLAQWSSRQGAEAVPKRTAAMYGMMAELPNRGDIEPMILDVLDRLFSSQVPPNEAILPQAHGQPGPSATAS